MQIPVRSSRPSFADRLLAWFADHARDLPWREARTPYRVWVAEVMLQQTRVDTVIPYYERFLARFPSVQAVAEASLEDVLKVWEGLGYYARARNLHAAARTIAGGRGGALPSTSAELLELPGVGRYIAGAIASIAFGEAVTAIDANARRVLCRAFAIGRDARRADVQREVETLAKQLLPADRAGPFNEALMELGATICTPHNPDCVACPLSALCQAHTAGDPESYPTTHGRRHVPHYDVTAALIRSTDGRVLIAQRNAEDMLGGLWEFPGGKCEEGETLHECLAREISEELGIEVRVEELLTAIAHAYTHFRITLHAFWCHLISGEPRCLDCAAFRWINLEDLEELPMSVVDRKVARAAQAHRSVRQVQTPAL